MKRNKGIVLIIIMMFTLQCVPLTMLGASGTVYHVGPGQKYNGTTQTVINQAISAAKAGDTVYLHAATYNISGPIMLKSGITLRGDGDSTVIHSTGANVCNSENETNCAYVIGNDVSNVTICYLRFTSTASQKNDGGHGNGRNCIEFRRASNCTVHNITFSRWLWNDGVRIRNSKKMTIHSSRINAAHDGVCFFNTTDSRIYNCDIMVQINNGVRTDGSVNIEIDHNNFSSTPELGGWCCIQVQNAAKNINIHHNIIHDTAGKIGVAPYSFSGSGVTVHDNVFWNCSSPIKVGSSANNTIDPSERNVKNWVAKGYGCGSSSSSANNNAAPTTSPTTVKTSPTTVKTPVKVSSPKTSYKSLIPQSGSGNALTKIGSNLVKNFATREKSSVFTNSPNSRTKNVINYFELKKIPRTINKTWTSTIITTNKAKTYVNPAKTYRYVSPIWQRFAR